MPTTTTPSTPPLRKRKSLSYQLLVGLLSLVALLLTTALAAIWLQGKPLLVDESLAKNKQIGISIVLSLSERISKIEGITAQIANFAKVAPKDEALFHQIVPSLLNVSGLKNVIAGGGVWPEPGTFYPNTERRSFFWGRDNTGTLKYYDDYNIDDGAGYHHTEWYVPARHLNASGVYWSRSYTDPYSLQTMVTCTAPIFIDNQFMGVSTVDLMLDGLSNILSSLTEEAGGYAFIVDRNNKFIAYPKPNMVLTERVGKDGSRFPDFLTTAEFSIKQPSFLPIANLLEKINNADRLKSVNQDKAINSIAQQIENNSDEIDKLEAQLVAAQLQGRSQQPDLIQSLDILQLDHDIILNDAINLEIFSMPKTNWKVITVFPSTVITQYATRLSINTSLIVILMLATFALASSILLRRATRRLAQITQDIRLSMEDTQHRQQLIIDTNNDEITELSYWFNRKTEQLTEAKQAAESANQAKSQFLASMSHELRTPMNAIMGFTHQLIKKLDGKIEQRPMDALVTIDKNANHLLNLINDILDVSKIEAGSIQIVKSNFFINRLLRDIHQQLSSIAEEKHLAFELETLKCDIEFTGDRSKILQILVNLVSNAFKATSEGVVTIKAKCEEQQLIISVTDTGWGIEQSDVEKLFQRFSQINNDIGSEKGTGLGLYLSQRFAREHNGSISLESELGQGSTFSLILPLQS